MAKVAWANVGSKIITRLNKLGFLDENTYTPSSGDTITWDGSEWVPDSTTYACSAFDLMAGGAAYDQTGFDSFTFTGANTYFHNIRRTSSGAQGTNDVVYALPAVLREGTWTFVLLHDRASNRGIYTIELSEDASSWTAVDSTIDGYAASADSMERTEATGVTVDAGMRFLRLRSLTKNASSSGYYMSFSQLSGVRTGN